tara:strand:+ start:783 stop:1601 length:819 start_codon:yes stop_codon:yes gene_type:complete
MSKKIGYDVVENLRKVMGTLPEEAPKIKTDFKHLNKDVEVTLEDHMQNPYKSMFVTSTSTWGNNEFQQKWPKVSPEGKLEVVKAVLTHNTLPQAREMIQFIFRVRGVPRWLFDYHTQVPFTSFMSIGCRDNNKSDVDIITVDNKELSAGEKKLFRDLKDIYAQVLTEDQSSWQSARSFLPQSYQHSYHFGQNLLSLVSMRGFNASRKLDASDIKDRALLSLYKEVIKRVGIKFPLIGHYLEIIFRDTEKVLEEIRGYTYNDLSHKDKALFEK